MYLRFFALFFSLFFYHSIVAESLAPGYGALAFIPEKPGTYSLPSLGKAKDGHVLTDDNEALKLHDLFDGKLIVLGFVYLSCNDINGCPLTTFVVSQTKKEVEHTTYLKNNVRFLSLSFDPKRDTPKILRYHAGHIGADDDIWSLITAKNEQDIAPILADYNQPIQNVYDDKGDETGKINHILRVFLIDKNKNIRNIYSTDFLHKDILIADLKTLLLDQNPDLSFEQIQPKENTHTSH